MLRRGEYVFHGFAGMIPGHSVDKYKWSQADAWDAIHPAYTTAEALALEERHWDGRVLIDGRPFRWDETTTVTDDGYKVAVKPTANTESTGAFLLDEAHTIMRFPVTKSTADAAALWTVPTGVILLLVHPFAWIEQITANWTGGTNAAVGMSTNKSGFNTKGDLLGGKGGLLAADLTTTIGQTLGKRGTLARPAGSVLFEENAAVASAAATPRFAVKQLLYAKTIGTGAPAVKAALINGATPSAGQAAPNAGGTSVVFHAETTGNGTADLSYLTDVAATFENTFLVAGDVIQWDRIASNFATTGAAVAAVAARIIKL